MQSATPNFLDSALFSHLSAIFRQVKNVQSVWNEKPRRIRFPPQKTFTLFSIENSKIRCSFPLILLLLVILFFGLILSGTVFPSLRSHFASITLLSLAARSLHTHTLWLYLYLSLPLLIIFLSTSWASWHCQQWRITTVKIVFVFRIKFKTSFSTP